MTLGYVAVIQEVEGVGSGGVVWPRRHSKEVRG